MSRGVGWKRSRGEPLAIKEHKINKLINHDSSNGIITVCPYIYNNACRLVGTFCIFRQS